MSAENQTRIYSGLGAAPGRASGKAHVIHKTEDSLAVPTGSILVMRILHPHLAPLLLRVAGLVVEEGALLQHATTLARECGIPAAVGIRNARNIFRDGELIEVDGYTGQVTAAGLSRVCVNSDLSQTPKAQTVQVRLTPLTDLGPGEYRSFPGGLYPGGQNSRPAGYEDEGVSLGATVQPVDANGAPSVSGNIVMISIGMSNASQEFSRFIRLTEAGSRKNPRLLLIDAARDGASATKVGNPFDDYWAYVDGEIQSRAVSAAQVQVAWLKTALARDRLGFPNNALLLLKALQSITGILKRKFPQLKLMYVSSRIYGGYSESALSPEPVAYESAFAVKWLIEERIRNPALNRSLPWISWGPYLWADGLTPRKDGLVWERADFEIDGVHTSPQGGLKVATKLLEFLERDDPAKLWFFAPVI